ncbi:MAG: DUF3341 domain-containing protein [Acidobacteria bacterium]|nr:DUF3341 domain-containing protein [Acidobacteriota bacterium]
MGQRLIVAVFDHEEDIRGAVAAARRAGLSIVDVHAPYLVHGLDRAMGLRPSRLPWICFLFGLVGAAVKLLFEYWTTAVNWPLNVGGKPWNSLPAFVPVTFEVMVLFAGIGTVLTFFVVAGLRPGRDASLPDPRVTDDSFALVLAPAPKDDSIDREVVEEMLSRFRPVLIDEQISMEPGR